MLLYFVLGALRLKEILVRGEVTVPFVVKNYFVVISSYKTS